MSIQDNINKNAGLIQDTIIEQYSRFILPCSSCKGGRIIGQEYGWAGDEDYGYKVTCKCNKTMPFFDLPDEAVIYWNRNLFINSIDNKKGYKVNLQYTNTAEKPLVRFLHRIPQLNERLTDAAGIVYKVIDIQTNLSDESVTLLLEKCEVKSKETRCDKCSREVGCRTAGCIYPDHTCTSYHKDAPDGGYYG